ncbi:MAG: T9SS type A sorting domain-containing protein [Chitinophagales bacterium]
MPPDLVDELTENTGVEEEEVVEQLNAEENDLSSFVVFPNPSSGAFSIDATYTSEAIMRVFDMSGRVLWQQNHTTNAIDLTHLNKGNYLLVISEGKKIQSVQIVISQ